MEFYKNKLINKTIDEFASTWSHTLDTNDFVDPKYLKKIDKYIFKNLKIKFAQIDIFHLLYLEESGIKLGIFQKLLIGLSGLRPLYNSEKKKSVKETKQIK